MENKQTTAAAGDEKKTVEVKKEKLEAAAASTGAASQSGGATTSTDVKQEKSDDHSIKDEAEKKSEESVEEKKDPLLNIFYSEIDDIKTEDFKTNSKEQLERLLRPGSTYFNLNPFEVLQIDPYTSVDEIKKKYRKLSIYVHPDKNPNDRERAQIAFEAVNRAYKMLDDEKQRKQCLEVVDEARVKVEEMCEEKRKKLKRELKAQQKSTNLSTEPEEKVKIDEDDPDKYRHAIYVMTCKLFADIERLKVREAEKQAQEKKRKAEERASEQTKTKIQKEWDKNYEESRQTRVNSWQNFMSKKGPGLGGGSKLPKFKPEKR